MVDDADAMKEAVLQHLGIADRAGMERDRRHSRGQMKALLPDYSVSAMPLHAVYPETHWMSARARSFLDFLICYELLFVGWAKARLRRAHHLSSIAQWSTGIPGPR